MTDCLELNFDYLEPYFEPDFRPDFGADLESGTDRTDLLDQFDHKVESNPYNGCRFGQIDRS